MGFIEVTVGSTKQLVNIDGIKSILPMGDGCSIYLRESGESLVGQIQARESMADMARLLSMANVKVLRLPD